MPPAKLHHVRADDPLVMVLRKKTPAQRLTIAHNMWSHARKLIVNVLKKEHPDWPQVAIEREAARRISHGAI